MKSALTYAEEAVYPLHIGIIMDGNGRWANVRGLPRLAGHAEGAEAVRRTVEASKKLGLRYLTLYGFSTENWKRPVREIDDLMQLFRHYLRGEVDRLDHEGVRIHFIGDRTRLEPDLTCLIETAEQKTGKNTELHLTVAISYGSRQEIVGAARQLAKEVQGGQVTAEEINENTFRERLSTGHLPDADLIIRTSGEQRISNFLLWHAAYAEFVFTDVLWPDFSGEDLKRSIEEYRRRERRYGAIKD